MSPLLKRFYHWTESKTLYIGSQVPTLTITLGDVKAQNACDKTGALLNTMEEIRFSSAPDTHNYGWYYPAMAGKPTFILSMGNCCAITSMLGYAELMAEGYGFLTYEYPGYGSTKGKPTEHTLYKSLETASDFLVEKRGVPVSHQIAYGISLGGAIATHVAIQKPFKALILESTMTCFPDVVKSHVGKFLPPWLLPLHEHVPSQLDSLSKIGNIQCPLLVMHGTGDPLLSYQYAKALYEQAGTPDNKKMLRLYPVNDHYMAPALRIEGIRAFIEEKNL